MAIDRYTTTTTASTTLPVKIGTTTTTPWRIFGEVEVPALPGDMLLIFASYEVTSEHEYNTMISRTISVSPTAKATPDQAGVLQIAKPMAMNFNGKAEHHFMDSLTTSHVVGYDHDGSPLFIAVTGYGAGSPTYATAGDTLALDRVDLQVLVLRGL